MKTNFRFRFVDIFAIFNETHAFSFELLFCQHMNLRKPATDVAFDLCCICH